MLEERYPNMHWDIEKWKTNSSSRAQIFLCKLIGTLLNDGDVVYNQSISYILRDSTKNEVEVDVWIPKHNLALEYQGQQHYIPTNFTGDGFEALVRRDNEKRLSCANAGITLIYIPYWWDFKGQSLAATIHKVCNVSQHITF
jgi:hypothetical protein